jgi:hypothetical protein
MPWSILTTALDPCELGAGGQLEVDHRRRPFQRVARL